MMRLLSCIIIAEYLFVIATPVHALGSWNSSVQGWIYPGYPACSAMTEIADGRSFAVLKPEYYAVSDAGKLIQRTAAIDGCNGYSPTNAALIKKYSQKQFVTVSAGAAALRALTAASATRSAAIATLSSFIQTIGFTGVELDFEEFSSWTATDYALYKQFLQELGVALHEKGLQLMIDGPAISNTTEQSYYYWKYEDINTLPVDQIVVMSYDYQYDYGAGAPIAPNAWVIGAIQWTKARIPNIDRIVIGMPSYGYHAPTGSYSIKIDTLAQSKNYPGFSSATRNTSSSELMWNYKGMSYAYQDTTSLNAKRSLIEGQGIRHISVWHLGGNTWFSGKTELTPPAPIPVPVPPPPCACTTTTPEDEQFSDQAVSAEYYAE